MIHAHFTHPGPHRAETSAVRREQLRPAEDVHRESLTTFDTYQKMDGRPGYDSDPLPGVFQGVDANGNTVRALLEDTPRAYSMRIQVVDAQGNGFRQYTHWDYQHDAQLQGRLRGISGMKINIVGTRAVGVSYTTSHPLAKGAGGTTEAVEYTSRTGERQTIPSHVVEFPLDADTARQQASEFDQAFEQAWQIAHSDQSVPNFDSPALLERAHAPDLSDDELDALLTELKVGK
ncbi:MAG: hypothetical protein AB7S38_28545 [Vulcanimicrobiota bacterium]